MRSRASPWFRCDVTRPLSLCTWSPTRTPACSARLLRLIWNEKMKKNLEHSKTDDNEREVIEHVTVCYNALISSNGILIRWRHNGIPRIPTRRFDQSRSSKWVLLITRRHHVRTVNKQRWVWLVRTWSDNENNRCKQWLWAGASNEASKDPDTFAAPLVNGKTEYVTCTATRFYRKLTSVPGVV